MTGTPSDATDPAAQRRVRVAVATGGRFHSFDLARELDRMGALACIHTGYPRFKLRDTGVDAARIATFPWLTTTYMALIRWPALPRWVEQELAWLANNALDRVFARKIASGEVDCDVVSVLSGGGLEIGRAAKARGIAYVCDRGSSHILVQDRLLKEEYKSLGLPWSGVDPRVIDKELAEYELADAITLPSGFTVESFVSQGVTREKLHQIPYGVNLDRFRRMCPRDDEFRVLFVGSLSVRKGIHYLLQGFERACLPNSRLVLVGQASAESEELFRRYPVASLERTGHLSRDGVIEQMSRASVMVLPSIEEGMATVLLQALACGCPIIASTNTGAMDLVTKDDVGYVIPIRDVEALAGRLRLLHGNPDLLRAKSAAAVERVRSVGGWDDYGRRSLALFAQLAGPGAARRTAARGAEGNAASPAPASRREVRVALATVGRFHSFDLARELDRLGALAVIQSGYPRFKLRTTGVDPSRIDTFPWLTAPYMALIRWPALPRRVERELAWFSNNVLDRRLARRIASGAVTCDVVSALSGVGLATGKAAQALGIAYVCDRGSSHISVQGRLLREEYEALGMPWSGMDPREVEKELAEYRLADAITLPSRFAMESFIGEGVSRAKLHYVPYGVDMSRFRRTRPRDPEFRVLYVGSHSVRKGIHHLLAGFARAKLSDARLVMVGGPSLEGVELIRRFPVDRIELTGHLTSQDVVNEMSRASVLVLPSVEDGFGLVLCQALACGCPIIATTNTGGPDLVSNDDVGFIVPIRDPDAIAERLTRLRENPDLLAAQSDAAVNRVRALGGWEQYGRLSLVLFRSLAARCLG